MSKISLAPSWLHKWSAFAVAAFGSMAAWGWSDVMTAPHAAMVVSGLGFAKLALEFITPDVPADSAGG